jgi:hypothetical protein
MRSLKLFEQPSHFIEEFDGRYRASAVFVALSKATSLVIFFILILSVSAYAFECSDEWRDEFADVVVGTGVASISHQCRDVERPCPPYNELQRRATEAARTLALADAQAKYASSIYAESQVNKGRVTSFASTAAGGDIYDIEYCTYVDENTVTVRLIGEK